MAYDVTMPQLGMTQDSGVILSWLKAVGDSINIGDALMEVETDKATVEVEATEAGYLVEISALAGSDIPVGDKVATISENADDIISTPAVGVEHIPSVETLNEKPIENIGAASPPKTVIANSQLEIGAKRPDGKILASPKAKLAAKERGFELSDLVLHGVSEPIHFKDVSDFKPILPSISTSSSSHMNEIVFTVLRKPLNDLRNHLNEQSGKNITVGNLWRMFVCGALRAIRVEDSQTDICVQYMAGRSNPFTCMNADRVLLSAQEIVECESQIDVSIYDYSATSITELNLASDVAHIATYITSKNNKKLKVKVVASDHIFTTDQALWFIDELIARLNNPLGYIA